MATPAHCLRLSVILFLCLASWASSVRAVVTTAVTDTYVSSASPAQSFGSASTLNVNSQSIALVKFDLGSLPDGLIANQIVKATVQLWVETTPAASGSINIFQISKAWDGASVTYGNKPPYLGTPKTTRALITGGSNYSLEADVTEQVKAWVTTPASNYGLALVAATAATNVSFDSKENTVTGHPPILDITLTSGKSVAVCLNATNSRLCTCTGKLISRVSGGSCAASSDSGPCNAMAAGMAADHPLASCCVCAP